MMNGKDNEFGDAAQVATPKGDDWVAINGKGPDGKITEILRFYPDGRIVKGPTWTTDDAMSMQFWSVVSETFPTWRKAVIERAIADRVVQVAEEYAIVLRTVIAAGSGNLAFDPSMTQAMIGRLQGMVQILNSMNPNPVSIGTPQPERK